MCDTCGCKPTDPNAVPVQSTQTVVPPVAKPVVPPTAPATSVVPPVEQSQPEGTVPPTGTPAA